MKLVESIYKEPEKWRAGEFRFTHESGASLWTANGFLCCEPNEGAYSLFSKWRAWRAYRWWIKNAPVERLKVV